MTEPRYRCKVCGWMGSRRETITPPCQAHQCPDCWFEHGPTLERFPESNLSGPLEEGLFGDRYMEWM